MPIGLETALISGAVVLLTALISAAITLSQVRRERQKWSIDLKTAYSLELYKTRLTVYPKVFVILKKLSQKLFKINYVQYGTIRVARASRRGVAADAALTGIFSLKEG